MKEKVMSAMQAFSKAMFMPVLILPIAGPPPLPVRWRVWARARSRW